MRTTVDFDKKEIINIIPYVVTKHIANLYSTPRGAKKIRTVVNALNALLNKNYEKYVFYDELPSTFIGNEVANGDFLATLSSLNEKLTSRKSNGVYNTPDDVIEFILSNSIVSLTKHKRLFSNYSEMKADLCHYEINEFVYNKKVFDPTVGSGEFLVKALQRKYDLLQTLNYNPVDEDYLSVLSTIFGNDIDANAVDICKVRLFFEISKIVSTKFYEQIANILNNNIKNLDFVNIDHLKFNAKFDIIIGNPPYVEDRVSVIKPIKKYGNIYANVLKNSVDLLTDNGIMGFIIPLSYVSTSRMRTIREYIERNMQIQYVLNYADRPGCLFSGVHQKLSILLSEKNEFVKATGTAHKIYSSRYHYWYSEERAELFNNVATFYLRSYSGEYYPKISNKIESNIFNKTHTENVSDSLVSNAIDAESNLYINMRACFWIKAFSFSQKSKEFKGFAFENDNRFRALAVLNSSLFFFHWVSVSDCWHITQKELNSFYAPRKLWKSAKLISLAVELEKKLERTKVYVGTRQTDYEYKHRLCKDIIDKIDDTLAKIYKLSETECEYVKSFAQKYREGRGA